MKKIKFVSLLLLVFISEWTFAQSGPYVIPSFVWGHNFSNANSEINQTVYHNGYLFTVGSYDSSNFVFGSVTLAHVGGTDLFIAKWDTLGNMIWANNISGVGNETHPRIQIASNNEIIVAGNSASPTLQIGTTNLINPDTLSLFYCKLDSTGNFISAYNYPSFPLNDMCLDYNNDIYVVGRNQSLNTMGGKMIKLDNIGMIDWTRTFPAFAGIENIEYSAIDSTVVIFGSYSDTLQIDTLHITPFFSPIGNSNMKYLSKLKLDSTAVWLVSCLNNYYTTLESGYLDHMYIIPQNGKIIDGFYDNHWYSIGGPFSEGFVQSFLSQGAFNNTILYQTGPISVGGIQKVFGQIVGDGNKIFITTHDANNPQGIVSTYNLSTLTNEKNYYMEINSNSGCMTPSGSFYFGGGSLPPYHYSFGKLGNYSGLVIANSMNNVNT